MNSPATCLSESEIQTFLSGQSTPAEMTEIENHLSDCDVCRQSIEEGIGPTKWWHEVEDSLRSDEERSLELDEAGMSGLNSQFLRMLGPTDDPGMLGRIGSYEIVGILGHGGMGVVFKGFDAALNRYVAIKVLLPHLSASGAARNRFAPVTAFFR